MVSVIFSDVDGTLINDDLEVTPRTRKVLSVAVDEGILFVPVSARMPEAIKPIIADFLPKTPIISYNGAFIQDENGHKINSSPMPVAVGVAICRYLENKHPKVAWNVYSGEEWLSQNRENKWIKREEEVVAIASQEADITKISELSEIHKLLLMGDPEEILTVEAILKEAYPELSIAKSYPYYLEIMASGIQKGSAILRLLDYYGIDVTETLAFGDNYNDLDMLETVGQGYVMANGPEAVRQKIGKVTSDNNSDGIAEVLEELLFSQK
ncbi:Cof-type HAD-IIB family hydrolase [Streptococcus pluranimalium]|uniref:Cof-type HAD-IIB family hydrolase n=1 Tax=Streptococcus pluranimalium TaxID=82348 RepID=A0A2L0D1U8_9STRE|nr:Cof-type HAD-IIB family hydrolase [Streptococcus pluranimalium]AUW95785.1 Cof-type HAD-IIB family hydrolase [Streptococcus pluranimalium]